MISVVEKSGDQKLSATGNVSATWAPQVTCPDSCPLKSNGCYAEVGNAGFQTRRLNAAATKVFRGLTAAKARVLAAKEEAAAIVTKLSGTRQLRVHVVGDCTTNKVAKLISGAMLIHEAKQGKAAWTYTHSWRTVDHAAWQGAKVVASCDSLSDIKAARQPGYGTAVIVPPHPTNKLYVIDGEAIIPCPAQFKHDGKRVVTCEHCSLCKRPDWLRANEVSVGFEPDHSTAKKVLAMIDGR